MNDPDDTSWLSRMKTEITNQEGRPGEVCWSFVERFLFFARSVMEKDTIDHLERCSPGVDCACAAARLLKKGDELGQVDDATLELLLKKTNLTDAQIRNYIFRDGSAKVPQVPATRKGTYTEKCAKKRHECEPHGTLDEHMCLCKCRSNYKGPYCKFFDPCNIVGEDGKWVNETGDALSQRILTSTGWPFIFERVVNRVWRPQRRSIQLDALMPDAGFEEEFSVKLSEVSHALRSRGVTVRASAGTMRPPAKSNRSLDRHSGQSTARNNSGKSVAFDYQVALAYLVAVERSVRHGLDFAPRGSGIVSPYAPVHGGMLSAVLWPYVDFTPEVSRESDTAQLMLTDIHSQDFYSEVSAVCVCSGEQCSLKPYGDLVDVMGALPAWTVCNADKQDAFSILERLTPEECKEFTPCGKLKALPPEDLEMICKHFDDKVMCSRFFKSQWAGWIIVYRQGRSWYQNLCTRTVTSFGGDNSDIYFEELDIDKLAHDVFHTWEPLQEVPPLKRFNDALQDNAQWNWDNKLPCEALRSAQWAFFQVHPETGAHHGVLPPGLKEKQSETSWTEQFKFNYELFYDRLATMRFFRGWTQWTPGALAFPQSLASRDLQRLLFSGFHADVLQKVQVWGTVWQTNLVARLEPHLRPTNMIDEHAATMLRRWQSCRIAFSDFVFSASRENALQVAESMAAMSVAMKRYHQMPDDFPNAAAAEAAFRGAAAYLFQMLQEYQEDHSASLLQTQQIQQQPKPRSDRDDTSMRVASSQPSSDIQKEKTFCETASGWTTFIVSPFVFSSQALCVTFAPVATSNGQESNCFGK
eukprot:TRINITY_DN64002_c0_g1_i1.p1 TRINITY_DN64002_c0_g1~~TRINITY_DN64002_c0_g1_i1.p1  ORF type:complete len:810 (+),score=60.14 TRINITY_DN64002_c0_g1_i1:2-2431(+)